MLCYASICAHLLPFVRHRHQGEPGVLHGAVLRDMPGSGVVEAGKPGVEGAV